jgi:hypothetical protein
MEELEYTIKQNLATINVQLEKVMDDMMRLQKSIEREDWHGYDSLVWVDGHAAEDMARMTSLVMQQRTLVSALHMVKKTQE